MRADARTDRIGATDAAALASLYGPDAPPSGSLAVGGVLGEPCLEGSFSAVLVGVAPAGASDFAWFDTDGDGDDEVLVWRTDADGDGDLVAHHFDARGLVRTLGPFLRAVPTGSDVFLHVTDDGQRCLVARRGRGADATFRIRAFRPTGLLGRVSPELVADLRTRFADEPPPNPEEPRVGAPSAGMHCRIDRVP
jgi:hypothetical protein